MSSTVRLPRITVSVAERQRQSRIGKWWRPHIPAMDILPQLNRLLSVREALLSYVSVFELA